MGPVTYVPRYRPEMVVAALLMALYVSHVALAVSARIRSGDRGGALAWIGGGSLSIGTGFWAMSTLGLLAIQPAGIVGHDVALSLSAWVVGVGAVFAALWTAQGLRLGVRELLVGGGIAGSAMTLMNALGAAALQLSPAVARTELAIVSITLTLGTGVLFTSALANGEALRAWRWRLPAAGLVGIALISQLFFALAANTTVPSATVDAPLLPADSLGILASLGAVVLLTTAWLMTRLDSNLHGRNEELAASLRRANEDLQRIAYLDPLTQLPNRLVFEDRLEQAVSKAQRDKARLALLFIDLDGFKPINDSFGHSAGDTILREVGVRLRALARNGDTMARVGGDEFLMLLESQPDEGTAAMVAQRVLHALSQPMRLGEREVTISCSIGVVFYPDAGASSKLIAHADAAMYKAKRAGGSTWCFFESSMDADAREQVELLRELRVAIEQGKLELQYQPKIDARSGKITAAEALLRWNHPTKGMIGPSTFIPIAERFGLIGALGNWVIEEVCRQAREWRDKGLRMRVAVNLSVYQLRQDDLVSRIQRALVRHRIDPSLLTCEITESVAMEDTRATQAAFQSLGQAGIHLSIDDFGTGYSSLSYLRQLPAEELKIDRSFVLDVVTSPDARAIVDAVVRLAHALGLKVVAEGVENEQQCQILLELGCDELQGFMFARPMPARALLLWAMDDRPNGEEFRPSLFAETMPVLSR